MDDSSHSAMVATVTMTIGDNIFAWVDNKTKHVQIYKLITEARTDEIQVVMIFVEMSGNQLSPARHRRHYFPLAGPARRKW